MATPEELKELKAFMWKRPKPDWELDSDNTFEDGDFEDGKIKDNELIESQD